MGQPCTRAGWSQSRLAERVGVSRQWISLVETGKTSVEFDLALAALQALGYRVQVESSDPATDSVKPDAGLTKGPEHGSSGRRPLTRGGEPLGSQRARRTSRDRDG